MFKKTIIAGLAATAILTAMASSASATPMGSTFDVEQENVLTNNPTVTNDELACYGCISPSTGGFRNNYVTPHFRSNGSFVSGYWRS